jgi:hypothetical protein
MKTAGRNKRKKYNDHYLKERYILNAANRMRLPYTVVNKDILWRLLLMGLGVLFILLFAHTKGLSRFMALAGLLFAICQIVFLLPLIMEFVNKAFPTKAIKKKHLSETDKVIRAVVKSLFFVGVAVNIFQIFTLQKTIGSGSLFWHAALYGFGFALTITILLIMIRPAVYYGEQERLTMHAAMFTGVMLLFAGGACYINRMYAGEHINCNSYLVTGKLMTGKRHNIPEIKLKTNYRDGEMFDVSQNLYDAVSGGSSVTVCYKKGYLGYDIITEIHK